MASRGGSGVVVLSVVLGILALAGFVLSIVFYGQATSAREQLDAYKRDAQGFIRDGERNSDQFREMLLEANGSNSSLAGFLTGQFRELSSKVSGVDRETPKSLTSKINAALEPLGKGNLLQGVQELGGQVLKLQQDLKESDAVRQNAVDSLSVAQDRVKALDESHQETVKTLGTTIDTYKGQVDTYRTDLTKSAEDMRGAVDKIKRDAGDETSRLNDRISRMTDELLVAQGKIRSLQAARGKDSLKPGDEATLVDGEVVALVDADNTVFINRGKNQRMVLGMSFEVYTDAPAIKLQADGGYARGKSSIEVIRVDDNSSTARIVRSTRGNPIARGDVIVNPVYDPSKKYTFLVYGNFDTDGDGRVTPAEGEDIRAMVAGWGGKLTESLTGDVDFVVLGERPVVPPAPPSDAAVEFVDRFIRARRAAEQYDRLLEQASSTSIPLLNQNRLMTLIGR